MKVVRTAAILMLAATVMFSSACKKKKPKLPPAATAPTVTVPVLQPTLPPPVVTPPPEPAPSTTTTTTTPTPEPKPKPKHHTVHKPKPAVPATPPPAATQPTKGNPATPGSGSNDAMTISPDIPKNEVDSQKRATEQMLQNAEANLRAVNRQLSDGEQGMVRQIRNYITQSRLATQDGDLERARNLAVKAQLLSGELIK